MPTSKRMLIGGFVMLLVAHPSAASTPPVEADLVIAGRVIDAATGAPIGGAQVMIEAESIGALTNTSGRYVLALGDSWIGREVAVSVRSIRYGDESRTLTLAVGANPADFALRREPLALRASDQPRRSRHARMEPITDHGNGAYAYVDGPLEARKVLVQEMGGTRRSTGSSPPASRAPLACARSRRRATRPRCPVGRRTPRGSCCS